VEHNLAAMWATFASRAERHHREILATIAFSAALFLLLGGFLALVGENRTAFDFQLLAAAGVFTVVADRQFAIRAADGDDRWENPGRALLGVYATFLLGLVGLLIQIPACAVLPSWLSWIRGALVCG
jgi:hypothetical protein